MLFKMYRDHFGTIPVEVTGDSPQPKPTFPAGGDQPAVNPGSDTYPLDVSSALSEDRKTLTIAVLNPSDAKQSMKLTVNSVKLASQGNSGKWLPLKSMQLSRLEKRQRFRWMNTRSARFQTRSTCLLQRQYLLVSATVAQPSRSQQISNEDEYEKYQDVLLTDAGDGRVAGAMISAQVQTIVPPVIPGAKPATVEHIKIHGAALEGNLEGDAVDRDVIVFLPPSYEKDKHRHYPVVYALHGYSIGAQQWSAKSMCRRPSKAHSPRRQGNDCRPARLEDRLQRLDVFEFRNHRRF